MTKWNAWKMIALILWDNVLSEEKQSAWNEINSYFAAQAKPGVTPEEVKKAFELEV